MNKKSFTLIELLVVIAIIGILSSLVIARFSNWNDEAKTANTLQWSAGVHRKLGANLVGHWPLNGNMNDISGYGNNGTVVGSPSWVSGVSGTGNQALYFNGTDECVRTVRVAQDDFTIIFWFKTTEIGSGETDYRWYRGDGLVDSEVNGVVNDFGISHHSNGYIVAGIGNPDTHIKSSSGHNNGIWNNVSFTRIKSTGAIKLYINGILVSSGTGGTNSLISATYTDIARIQAGHSYFNGSISDVRIYDTALTAEEVSRIYAETKDSYLVYE